MTKNESCEPLSAHPKYKKIKSLNRGSYGFVQLAQNRRTGENVAIKFIPRGDKVTKYVEREIVNHSKLLHPHIVQFKEVFLTDYHLAIVMEYAAGGDLFQYVRKKKGLSEDEARWFFQQLITGLDYCHKKGVVSRDIKLENTLLDTSRRPLLKICDFGYSKHENDSLPKSKVGTPGYTAPEVITHRVSYDGAAADIWSAGVLLYVMLFRQYPFERIEDEQHPNTRVERVLHRIIHVDYNFPSDVHVSKECKDMMAQIFQRDPAKRLTVSQIQIHPWYQKHLPPGLNEFNDQCLLHQQRASQSQRQTADPSISEMRVLKAILENAKLKKGQVTVWEDDKTDAYDVDYMLDDAMADDSSI